MSWPFRRWGADCQRWPCPFCRQQPRVESGREPCPELYVYRDRTFFCLGGCETIGGPNDLQVVKNMLAEVYGAAPSSRTLQLAQALHRGPDAERRLRQMARTLWTQWRERDPGVALELLHPWALVHVSPPPTYQQCKDVLGELVLEQRERDRERQDPGDAPAGPGAGGGERRKAG